MSFYNVGLSLVIICFLPYCQNNRFPYYGIMTQILGASISTDQRKKILSWYSTADILLLAKAYKINIHVRMLQASEMYQQIQGIIKDMDLWNDTQLRNILRTLDRFVKKDSEWLGLQDFQTQYSRLANIIHWMERWDISFVEWELANIWNFLNSSLPRFTNNTEGLVFGIDYERIVSRKTIIKHKLSEHNDTEVQDLLSNIYLYYTQFWRMLEMYGDFYNDLDILLSRERLGDKYDIFFDKYFIFQKKYPYKAIKIWWNKIEFNKLTVDEKKWLILLYTLLMRPWESIEAITTFCQLYRVDFWLRNTKLKRETIARDYFSRLNKFLNVHWPIYTCQKDKYGFKITIKLLP